MSSVNDNIKKIDINKAAYNNNSMNVNTIVKKKEKPESEDIDDNLSNESSDLDKESVASSDISDSDKESVASSNISDSDKESVASSDSSEFNMGSETAESTESSDTIKKLSADPLFLVLSNFLSNGDENIVDVLLKINKNLEKLQNGVNKSLKLNKNLEKLQKNKKSKSKHVK